MPLDVTAAPDHLLAPAELFARRRAAAVALWASVPAANFSLRYWVTARDTSADPTDCRTVACAVGWLGVRRHDGWRVDPLGSPHHPVGQLAAGARLTSMETVAAYFGLPYEDAVDVFGPLGRAHAAGPDATLADVAAALLRAPYRTDLVAAPLSLETRLGGAP